MVIDRIKARTMFLAFFIYVCVLKNIKWEEVISAQSAARFRWAHLEDAVLQELRKLQQRQPKRKPSMKETQPLHSGFSFALAAVVTPLLSQWSLPVVFSELR